MKAGQLLILCFALALSMPLGALADEAMCESHGVLEAVCTRCHPRLATIFKSKGDWCEEHQFPESFCPTCHPERKGSPAGEVADEKVPSDGLRVDLESEETVRRAGIEVTPARAAEQAPGVFAWVRLARDPARMARVNPRSAGVVRALAVRVGERVEAGQDLARVESATVGADRSRLEAARTRVRVGETNLERQTSLVKKGVGIGRDLLAAEQELALARAEVESASASLKVVGDPGEQGPATLVAPMGGVVTDCHVTLGEHVDAEDILYEIVDTSTLWAELAVSEADAGQVREGQIVEIVLAGLPGRKFPGTITSVAPELDPRTRTVIARVILDNPDGSLRVNMYGEARISTGKARGTVSVPRSSLQRVEDAWLAFVRVSPSGFETRRVRPGELGDETVHLFEGIAAGEEVATTGSFLLKTETLKGSIGAGCCEVEEKR